MTRLEMVPALRSRRQLDALAALGHPSTAIFAAMGRTDLTSAQGHFANGAHGHQLTSWAQWKAALLSGGRIRSESGYWVPAANLIADIENVAPAGRRRQYDWLDARRGTYGEWMDKVAPGCDWLDADGFSFHGGEFS